MRKAREMRKRDKINQFIAEIPDDLLERAYCLDVIQRKLQLKFSEEVYKKFIFRETHDRFLEAGLSNGLEVIMEGDPLITNNDYGA